MSQLTTHVLDSSIGKPAEGVEVILEQLQPPGDWKKIAEGVTNADGRISDLLVSESLLTTGNYRLVFETSSYFQKQKKKTFYPKVLIEFEITDTSHVHVPLLLSPYSYSTYRGS